jgi:hypothetical protein
MLKVAEEDLMTITPLMPIIPVNLHRLKPSFISPATKSLRRPNRTACALDSGDTNAWPLFSCVAQNIGLTSDSLTSLIMLCAYYPCDMLTSQSMCLLGYLEITYMKE